MVGRSKSDTKKAQLARATKDGLMARAVASYQFELGRPAGEKRKGLRTICKEVEGAYFKETKVHIKLDHKTLSRLAAGGKNIVINYAIETAAQGFPLSHRRLQEHVNAILRGRLGSSFPEKGVGR